MRSLDPNLVLGGMTFATRDARIPGVQNDSFRIDPEELGTFERPGLATREPGGPRECGDDECGDLNTGTEVPLLATRSYHRALHIPTHRYSCS
jgi:hypothetical protein